LQAARIPIYGVSACKAPRGNIKEPTHAAIHSETGHNCSDIAVEAAVPPSPVRQRRCCKTFFQNKDNAFKPKHHPSQLCNAM